MVAVLVALAGAACGRDVRLGGPVDAPPPAFTAGAYTASFLDPVQVMCSGTLAGHEADFSGVTRAQSNLVDGAVQLAPAANQLVISGSPVSTAFGVASVTLVPDPGSAPPELWDTSVSGSFGSGPDATTAIAVALALDSATAHDPGGIQGAIAREYQNAAGDGVCSATFGALLVRS